MDFIDLGLVDFKKALTLQEGLVEKRYANIISDTIIICSHPPVVTLGRSTKKSDLQGWKGDTFEVRRGGRATYHGPKQLVVYPIVNLNQQNFINLKIKDVMCFLKLFEQAILSSLKLTGYDKMVLKEDVDFDENGKQLLNRGIWCDGKKTVAFGIAVRKWVTYHGCAINLYADEKSFQGIQPCGYSSKVIGSLDKIQNFDLKLLKKNLKTELANYLI